MKEHTRTLSRRAFLGGAAAFGAVSLVSPQFAFGEPTAAEKQAEADAVRIQVTEMQNQLNQASDDYYKAIYEHDDAVAAVEAAQGRIDEANAQISDLQTKLGSRARNMYRSGSTSFLDILLGAATFEEFATNWDLLTAMNKSDAEMVEQTKTLRAQIEEEKAELSRQEEIAAQKEQEALEIKEEAEATVAELQAILDQLDAEARELLEKEQAAAREAAAAAAAAEAERLAQEQAQQAAQNSGNTGGGNSGGGNTTTGGDTNNSYTPPVDNGYTGGGGTSYPGVVDAALSRIGCPYVWGAEGPDAFDCSGLVTWSYRQVGISVYHQSEMQYNQAVWRGPVSEAQPGDVLWRYGHVGIACCAGGSWYVHAPTFGAYVRDTDSLSWSGFTHALRFA